MCQPDVTPTRHPVRSSSVTHSDILITGATGFVGGELLAHLRDRAATRVIVRDAAKLEDRAGIDVVEGNLDDAGALAQACAGVSTAYYLVHSMEPGTGDDFAARDRELAESFRAAADTAGITRIVYLGGVDPGGETSEHLESRHEVEELLGAGTAQLVALRASMIVGADSDSFRTLAQIVQRLPVLALPSWRDTRTQPVAIADVVAALDRARADDVAPGVYDIAGPTELTITEMIDEIADLTGKKRPTFPIPISSARLEGAAAALVTDADREVLEPLMAGLHEDLVVEDNALQPVFGVRPTPFTDAARDALADI
jgi:uncharacterized protein YbjT (DUF2867 family)